MGLAAACSSRLNDPGRCLLALEVEIVPPSPVVDWMAKASGERRPLKLPTNSGTFYIQPNPLLFIHFFSSFSEQAHYA